MNETMLDEERERLKKVVDDELDVLKKSKIEPGEFDNFVRRVNEVESIVNGLASHDLNVSEKAMKKADLYLHDMNAGEKIDVDNCNVVDKANRTVINQKAFDEFYKEEEESNGPQTMSKEEAFMRSVEEDAKKRTQDRRDRKEVADRYKLAGNKAFREEDYEKALDCYNKAIMALTDSTVLYTNRALTSLKLGLNKRALEDAEWALRINEHSVKGFIYKAQALHNLGRYEESKNAIDEACTEIPDKADYFKEVQLSWQKGDNDE